MANRGERGGCGGVAWLALVVSLVALFFSWKAYERSGGTIGEDLENLNPKVSVGDETPPDWQAELDRARDSLTKARESLDDKGADLDKVREDVARLRENLSDTFKDASEGARDRWKDLDKDLEGVQSELREGGARAKESLDKALDKLRG